MPNLNLTNDTFNPLMTGILMFALIAAIAILFNVVVDDNDEDKPSFQ